MKIWAPLINGEEYLRNLPPMKGLNGPYSSGYGGPLYALISDADIEAALKAARGKDKKRIKSILDSNR